MEVSTHSPAVIEARQFILQMYLIDHALDCPTCDKSGECYLQDNTYLHNVNANPYRRPKLAQPYTHFSDTDRLQVGPLHHLCTAARASATR